MLSTDNKESFARILRAYRMEREWSLQKMSVITRITGGTLCNLERGKTRPAPITLHKLCKALPDLAQKLKQSGIAA